MVYVVILDIPIIYFKFCKKFVSFCTFQRVARIGGQSLWDHLWCVLDHASLKAWENKDDVGKKPPVETIDVKPVSRSESDPHSYEPQLEHFWALFVTA